MTRFPDAAELGTGDDPALVLIVEDEEPLAETVGYVVRAAGYRPLVAFHGRQGLELARGKRPALLIVDLMLPHLDGSGIIAALRADATISGEPPPPCILMTAANLPRARAAHADAVLLKPFQLADLETLLRRFLGPSTLSRGEW
ncbi:MAG TPA: response regulator [Chloroflexota bacterium]|nr:response regulator [Chloroflexota bacterium]